MSEKKEPISKEERLRRMAAGRKAAAEKRQLERESYSQVLNEEPRSAAPPPPSLTREPDWEVEAEDGPSLPPAPDALIGDAFDAFVLSLDDLTRSEMSEAELREIWATQMAKAEAEKRASRKKAVGERALERARIATGALPAATSEELLRQQRMHEMVTYTPNLPPSGGEGIRSDQRVYLHGRQVTIPRHEYDSLRDMENRAWRSEAIFKGEQSTYYDQLRGRTRDPWSGGFPTGSRDWVAK